MLAISAGTPAAALAAAPGSVSGTVVDSSTQTGISGIEVQVQDTSGNFVANAFTAADGTYSVTNVPAGTYVVAFNPNQDADYVSQYYNGKSDITTADPVSVASGADTPNINGSLAPASGHITGTVTAATGGGPVANVSVEVQDSSGFFVASATTDANGNYTVEGLSTGSYVVSFQPPHGANYVAQFYNGKSNFNNANPVSVTSGATTANINASLATGGTITGTVTDASTHAPLANIEIDVFDASGSFCSDFFNQCGGFALTASDGSYSVTGLPSGTYFVEYVANGQNYITQYYNGKPSEQTADPVGVTAGSTTANINSGLAPGGQIAGVVTDSAGTPLPGVEVEALDSSGDFITAASTGADGTYTLRGLKTASYRVEFFPGNQYVSEYYNGASTLTAATPVPVTAGSTDSGINAALPPASAGGRISGAVTATSTGLPVSGVSVTIYDSGGNVVTGTSTGSDGSYTSPPLLGGSYKVGFSTSVSLAFQYFNGQSTLTAANAVAVAPGANTPGVNAQLSAGGTMSGTVTDASSHAALPSVGVDLLDSAGHVLDSATTGPDGTYTMGGIPTGSYHVEFVPFGASLSGGAPYARQFYSNKLTLSGSDTVGITAPSNTANINAGLIPLSSVTVPTPPTPTPPPPKAGPPTISGSSLTGIAKRKATLKFKLASGNNNAPKIKSFKVKAPGGLSFKKKGLKKGLKVTGAGKFSAKISHGRLVVTMKAAAAKISVKINSKAISVSKALAKKAKKHKVASLKVGVSVTDAKGKITSFTLKFKKPH